jgi:hypothetical protein
MRCPFLLLNNWTSFYRWSHKALWLYRSIFYKIQIFKQDDRHRRVYIVPFHSNLVVYTRCVYFRSHIFHKILSVYVFHFNNRKRKTFRICPLFSVIFSLNKHNYIISESLKEKLCQKGKTISLKSDIYRLTKKIIFSFVNHPTDRKE